MIETDFSQKAQQYLLLSSCLLVSFVLVSLKKKTEKEKKKQLNFVGKGVNMGQLKSSQNPFGGKPQIYAISNTSIFQTTAQA